MMVAKHGSTGCWPSYASVDMSKAMHCMDWGVNEPCFAGDDVAVIDSSFEPLLEEDDWFAKRKLKDPLDGWYR